MTNDNHPRNATLESLADILETNLAAAEQAPPDQIPDLLREQLAVLDLLFAVLLGEGLSLTTINLALRAQSQYRQTIEKTGKIILGQKRENFAHNQTEGPEKCKQ